MPEMDSQYQNMKPHDSTPIQRPGFVPQRGGVSGNTTQRTPTGSNEPTARTASVPAASQAFQNRIQASTSMAEAVTDLRRRQEGSDKKR